MAARPLDQPRRDDGRQSAARAHHLEVVAADLVEDQFGVVTACVAQVIQPAPLASNDNPIGGHLRLRPGPCHNVDEDEAMAYLDGSRVALVE